MSEWVVVLLGGASAASLITTSGNIVIHFLQRKDKKADKKEESQQAILKKLDAIVKGLMLLEQDKIKYLGLKFIAEREISYEDRCMLHRMHDNYHNELGGNGDLDPIMDDVDKLPLKQARKR